MVERLSHVAAFSTYHFHRQFSALFGIGVVKCVQLRRLKRASYQLAFSLMHHGRCQKDMELSRRHRHLREPGHHDFRGLYRCHCPRILIMTVTRSRMPPLSGLPERYPDEPFNSAGTPKSAPAPKPVNPEDVKRQQQAGRQMRDQISRTMNMPSGTGRGDKKGGPLLAAPYSATYLQQRGPRDPAYRKPVPPPQGKPPDEVIPEKNWALEPKEYEELSKDPRVMFHTLFYRSESQALPPPLNPQDRVPMRNPSELSAKSYPPRTAQAQPFLPNNKQPISRNPRSWQAPQQAAPYPHGPSDNAPTQSNVPPPLPPRKPPPRPPKEPLE